MTDDTTSLFNALDNAAVALLKLMDEPTPTVDSDGEPSEEPLSTLDRVKVFQAVVDYAATRAKVVPAGKTGTSKFDRIKEGFHGTSTNGSPVKRRTRVIDASPAGGTAEQ